MSEGWKRLFSISASKQYRIMGLDQLKMALLILDYSLLDFLLIKKTF